MLCSLRGAIMANLLYACRFEVPIAAGLAPVLSAYSDWITRHYQQRRGLSDFSLNLASRESLPQVLPGHSLLRSIFASEKGDVVRLEWSYPSDTDPGLVWRNEVRIGAFGQFCSVEHLIWIESIDYNISPPQIALGSPSVIRRLCSDSVVQIGDMRVKATPYPLPVKGVPDFIELLQSSRRRLPIVFLSPYAGGDPSPIDAESMAQHLAGVAIVVHAQNAEATWDVADAIGRTLSCFNGAARIYWPGFTALDDPRRHPLYLGIRIENSGAAVISRAIQRSIFAVASFRFAPDSRISSIISEAEQLERVQRVEVQKASIGVDWETYALEIDTELSAAKQTITNLQAENENLKENQQVYLSARDLGDTDGDVVPAQIIIPDSVKAAVEHARQTCENLSILDSAISSAEGCPFQRPAEVLEALQDLDEVASDWGKFRKERGSGGDLRQHLIARGWGKRCSLHISNTTRARYATHYTFEYDGQRQLFEPHITLGSGDPNSCASVHFKLDERTSKIVVAHVGRHLPNTKK